MWSLKDCGQVYWSGYVEIDNKGDLAYFCDGEEARGG